MSVIYLNPSEAAEEAVKNDLKIPESDQVNRTKTLNNYGYMRTGRGVFEISTRQFLEIAAKPGSKVLEIGAAYGEVVLEALRKGAMDYTAVDLEEDHLKILARRVREELPEKLTCVKLIFGGVPNPDFDKYIEKGSFDAILIENVLHFLDKDQILETLSQIHSWLKPGGKIFSINISFYLGWIKPEIRQSLKEQVAIFQKDPSKIDQIPGFFHNRYELMNLDKYQERIDDIKKKYAGQLFVFHTDVIRYFFEKAEFVIEECCFRQINVEPFKLDGKESVMIIAKK
uniref:Methyltransferase domain-containing protein n=1 Tax=Acrobeloides nanus TaxID=290746 RepID=A0A914DZF7_9BILA